MYEILVQTSPLKILWPSYSTPVSRRAMIGQLPGVGLDSFAEQSGRTGKPHLLPVFQCVAPDAPELLRGDVSHARMTRALEDGIESGGSGNTNSFL